MKNKTISIIIGVLVIVGVGTVVYTQKQLTVLPTDTQNQIPGVSTNNTSTPPKDTIQITNGIPLSQVIEHNSRASCWSVVNGNVYDLTSWIPNHPGGEARILSMCGVDGSDGYNGEHGGKSKPAKILAGFKLGPLLK